MADTEQPITRSPGILLREYVETVDATVLEEAAPNGIPLKQYYFEGIYLQGNTLNKNDRIYPTPVLAREVVRYDQEIIQTNRSVGECGHSSTPNINLERACHKIVSLRMEGDNVWGKSKVLNYGLGHIVKGMIDDNVRFGVSSRGVGGTTKTRQGIIVGDDFMMSAVDVVYDPSAPKAFVSALMEERILTHWVFRDGIFVQAEIDQQVQLVEETQEKVEEIVRETTFDKQAREQKFALLFEEYLHTLSKTINATK